jgi:hydrogenase maturation factor HypF (carbamoyltransferase family)
VSAVCLKENEFTIYNNEQIPVNDGGLALGQLYIAEKITEVDENVSCYTNAGC